MAESILQSDSAQKIVRVVNQYHFESDNALRSRRLRDERNRMAYDNIQDWGHKIDGQSTEYIPKTSQTVEQFVAFLKRGLVQFGPWFQMQVGKGAPIDNASARAILMHALDNLPRMNGNTETFAEKLSDNLKVALLECAMTWKVYGFKKKQEIYSVEGGDNLVKIDLEPWVLHVDAIRPEDYNWDLSGRGLYEIHTVERDLYQVQEMAEAGVYDPDVISQIKTDFEIDQEKKDRDEHETSDIPNENRLRVVVREMWGTIIDYNGDVLEKNTLCAIANDKYLIRPPEPNPNWHGGSPFERIPLLRKPFSEIHKSLYDEVVPLNEAMNELFNLMLDGAIASVWGVRQVRPDLLEDPSQISGGIAQNKTLVLKAGVPDGTKVIEQVTEGQVSAESGAMFSILNEVLNGAAKTNEINLGLLPTKQVKATEVVEASQNSAVVLDSIVADLETGLNRVLRKAWLTMLQNADDLSTGDLAQSLSRKEMLALSRMSERERFATMANGASFKVDGLSATLAKARDFQKIMALMQVAQQSPILFNAFVRKYSGPKILDKIIKVLNINPIDIERSEDEDAEAEVKNVLGFLQLFGQTGGQVGAQTSAGTTGEPGLPSEINQATMPSQVA